MFWCFCIRVIAFTKLSDSCCTCCIPYVIKLISAQFSYYSDLFAVRLPCRVMLSLLHLKVLSFPLAIAMYEFLYWLKGSESSPLKIEIIVGAYFSCGLDRSHLVDHVGNIPANRDTGWLLNIPPHLHLLCSACKADATLVSNSHNKKQISLKQDMLRSLYLSCF